MVKKENKEELKKLLRIYKTIDRKITNLELFELAKSKIHLYMDNNDSKFHIDDNCFIVEEENDAFCLTLYPNVKKTKTIMIDMITVNNYKSVKINFIDKQITEIIIKEYSKEFDENTKDYKLNEIYKDDQLVYLNRRSKSLTYTALAEKIKHFDEVIYVDDNRNAIIKRRSFVFENGFLRYKKKEYLKSDFYYYPSLNTRYDNLGNYNTDEINIDEEEYALKEQSFLENKKMNKTLVLTANKK